MAGAEPIRRANADDADAIASLHARSWLRAYRGILTDEYLDGPMRAERAFVWRARFADLNENQITFVADGANGLAGFVCLFTLHGDPPHNYIDNLHVAPALHGTGLGRRLIRTVAAGVPAAHAQRPVSLTVFEANRQACAFYVALGGRIAERLNEVEADGRRIPTLRFVWDNVTGLL